MKEGKALQKEIHGKMINHGLQKIKTYLHVVHLVLADNFDGDFAILPLSITSTVDVAEGAIAHLLQEDPSLKAGVLGELCPGGIFFGDELGEVGVVNTSACALGGGVLLASHLFGRFGEEFGSDGLRDERIGN